MTRRRFRAMNTAVEILIDARPSPTVERLCDLAESEFSRYEQTFSRFREDSELSRLNQTGRAQPSPQLAEVIRLALAARDRTRGRFDPTVHDALVGAGYDRSFEHVGRTDGPGVATAAARCCGEVVIDTVSGAITLGYGFGSIWAVSRRAMRWTLSLNLLVHTLAAWSTPEGMSRSAAPRVAGRGTSA